MPFMDFRSFVTEAEALVKFLLPTRYATDILNHFFTFYNESLQVLGVIFDFLANEICGFNEYQ